MYTSINVDAFKQRLQLPADYKIDGLLASGTWDLYAKNRHVPHLESAFKSLGINSKLIKIETEELGHAYEFTVEGKRYWFVPVMGTAVMSQYAHLASLLGSKKEYSCWDGRWSQKWYQARRFYYSVCVQG